MRKLWFLCFLWSLFLFAGCASTMQPHADKPTGLKIYTETYPPLNFAEGGRGTGLSVEVVRELMKRTNTAADVQLASWEEGYQAVMQNPNVGLFTVAMTQKRKPLLQWVGPITVLDTNFYARKGSQFGIRHLADAKKLPKIVVAKDYYTEQLLKNEGFPNVESVATEEIALRKLLNGEAQLFPCSNVAMPALLKAVGAAMDDVESV